MLKNILLSILFASFCQAQVAGTIFVTKKDRQNITNLQRNMLNVEWMTNSLGQRITWVENKTNNWNTAYGWGDWNDRVYMLESRTNGWNSAFSWGDHSLIGYITTNGVNVILNDYYTIAQTDVIKTNLQGQIDILMDEVYYVAPSVSWLSSSSGTYEKGSTKVNINLGFSVNKDMTARTYSGGYSESLGVGNGNIFTYVANITEDSVFTITVTDVRGAISSASQILYFRNRKYYGASGNYPLSNPEIIGLTVGWEARGNSSSGITLTDQYIYVAYPARLGLCTSFALGGFATSAWPYETVSVINSSGFSESFYVYRSANKLTAGSTTYDIH